VAHTIRNWATGISILLIAIAAFFAITYILADIEEINLLESAVRLTLTLATVLGFLLSIFYGLHIKQNPILTFLFAGLVLVVGLTVSITTFKSPPVIHSLAIYTYNHDEKNIRQCQMILQDKGGLHIPSEGVWYQAQFTYRTENRLGNELAELIQSLLNDDILCTINDIRTKRGV
jgi:hypothetical protein